MTAVVLVAGLVALALGGCLATRRASLTAGLTLQAAGASAVGVAGFWALAAGAELGAGFSSTLEPRLGVDGLSGLFLGTVG
ncbi:MAG: hypothetical protein ACRDNB_05235, partial [Gaiellaceae bacterium]